MEEETTVTKDEIKFYWGKFFKRAAKYAWSTSAMQSIVIGLLGIVLLAGIVGTIITLGILPIRLFDEQINNVRAGFWILVSALVFFVIAFVCITYRIPVEIYTEQKSSLAKKDLDIEERDNRIRQFYKIPVEADIKLSALARHKAGYASVRVHNEEIEDLHNCYLSFVGAWQLNGDREEDILGDITGDKSYISWAGGNTNQGVILGDGEGTFNVAMCAGKTFEILMNDGTRVPREPGLYKIKVKFDARLGKDKIIPKTATYFLEYGLGRYLIPTDDPEEKPMSGKAPYIDIRNDQEKSEKIALSMEFRISMNMGEMLMYQKEVALYDEEQRKNQEK